MMTAGQTTDSRSSYRREIWQTAIHCITMNEKNVLVVHYGGILRNYTIKGVKLCMKNSEILKPGKLNLIFYSYLNEVEDKS